MQVLIAKDGEDVGHFSWELPDEIAAMIEKLPKDKQAEFRESLTVLVRTFLHLMVGAVFVSPLLGRLGLDTINEHLLNMSLELGKQVGNR